MTNAVRLAAFVHLSSALPLTAYPFTLCPNLDQKPNFQIKASHFEKCNDVLTLLWNFKMGASVFNMVVHSYLLKNGS